MADSDVLAPPATTDPLKTKAAPVGPLDTKTLEQKEQDAAEKTKEIVGAESGRWGAGRESIKNKLDAAASIVPPKAPELKPMPPEQTTSPAEAWGSLAMLAAGLGGAMTRSHATTAISAAGEVLKGFHQGDMERNKEAFDRWKQANDQLVQTFSYQNDVYKALMASVNKGVSETIAVNREDRLQASAEASAFARSFHDDLMLHRLEMGDWTGAQKLLTDREKLYDQLLEKSGQNEQAFDLTQKLSELRQTDEYKAADPMRRYGMEYATLKEISPFMDQRGNGSKQDLAIAKQVYGQQFADPTGANKVLPGSPKFDDWYDGSGKDSWKNWGGGEHHYGERGPYKKGDVETDKDGKQLRYKGTGSYKDKDNWEPVDKPEEKKPEPEKTSSTWDFLFGPKKPTPAPEAKPEETVDPSTAPGI